MLDSENNKLRLWERSFEDSDFLAIRVGLGNRLSEVKIKIPKQGFQLYEDELRKLPSELSQKYGTLELAKIENMRTQAEDLAAGKFWKHPDHSQRGHFECNIASPL